jgi:CubicO group peptidase (beta-lactamase class C family)
VIVGEQLTRETLADLDYLAGVLARMTPEWSPGTRHGYHAMSIGFFMQELIRRVDPQHRSLGEFFADEIARPLGLDFFIGLPKAIPSERVATVRPLSPARALAAIRSTPLQLIPKVLWPWSLLRKSLAFVDLPWNERSSLEVEVPAGTGVGTARAIARAYSAFADGGAELGVTPATFAQLVALPATGFPKDEILGVRSHYSLGFLRPGPELAFGSSPRAFGAPGAGGSFGFADPDVHLGYAGRGRGCLRRRVARRLPHRAPKPT